MLNKYRCLRSDAILPWEKDFTLEVADKGLPSLSIVIPIYNSANFLEKTLRSLLCNDLSGVELILMDGGSLDGTMSIVEHYKDMFSYIQTARDKGQSDAINNGYKNATGEIFYWLNGDDIILPNVLNKVREYFKLNPDCNVLIGNAYMTEFNFSPINHFVFSEEKLTFSYLIDYAKNHLIQPSVFFSRKAWESQSELDIDNHYSMDADLFIGFAKKYKLHHLNMDLAYSVYHEECKTRAARAESIVSLALVQAKHGGQKEAINTLNILIDMYKELIIKCESGQASASDKKIQVMESRLETIQSHIEEQKSLMIKLDLEVNG
jgi:glycosyltransferase involved in cell wall biosynthesis